MSPGGAALFRFSAAAALSFHAALLLATDGVHGGGDLTPHLRLVQRMGEAPGIHNVYPPAYHALGALLTPLLGPAAFAEWFAFASAAALILAFRVFQRAAGLPDACAALFAVFPYLFALTRCLPKVEALGYAVALLGLALLLLPRRGDEPALGRRELGVYAGVAGCVLVAFLVHTATALFLGLVGGVVGLVRRDVRALLALGAGTLLAAPLLAAHLADGCSFAQALLFSRDDYLRAAPRAPGDVPWLRIALLGAPTTCVAALVGAPRLATRSRALLAACAVMLTLYLNELWLAPFGGRTTLDLLRGLTVLAIPASVCAGLAVERRPRAAVALVVASGITAVATTLWLVPTTCVTRPVDVTRAAQFDVDRCMFRWRPRASRVPSARSGATQRLQVRTHAVVHGTTAGQGATQELHGLRDLAAHGVGGRDAP